MDELTAYIVAYTKDRRYAYFISNGHEIKARASINVNEKTLVKGYLNGEEFMINEYWQPDDKEMQNFIKETEKNIKIVKEPAVKSIENAARIIKTAQLLRRQNIIRFHNDADGIVSALLIGQVLQGNKIAQHAAVYSLKDAFSDIALLRYGDMPIAVFLDFGGSNECKDAYELLKYDNIDVLVIDHHPVDEEIKNLVNIANPLLEGKTSDYTTGYLCNELLLCLGINPSFDYTVSLAGDKSSLAYSDKAKKTALALDYAAFYSAHSNAIALYKEIMTNDGFMDSIAQKANEKIFESLIEIKKNQKKRTIGNFSLYYIDAEKQEKSFPPYGKNASLHAEDVYEPALIVSCSKYLCSFRLSKKAKEHYNIDLNMLVNEMKKRSDIVISGGGHKNAASIKINEKAKDLVIDITEEIIRHLLEK
ncbi:MAG: hypothetical protein QXS91_00510 [Candidatus Anstonellales archaeon]